MFKVVFVSVGGPVQPPRPDSMTPGALVDRQYLLSGVDRFKLQFRHFGKAHDPTGGGSQVALV